MSIRLVAVKFLVFMQLLLAAAANAAVTYRELPMQDGKVIPVLEVSGEFQQAEFVLLENLLRDYPGVQAVHFTKSPGGLLFPGLDMGAFIREKGLATIASGHCFSACALAWLGGEALFSIGAETVGFHAAWDNGGSAGKNGDRIPSGPGNARVGAFLVKLGYEENVIDFVTMAPPDSISFLSQGAARFLNLSATFLNDTTELAAYFETVPATSIKKEQPDDNNRIDNVADIERRLFEFGEAERSRSVMLAYLQIFPNGKYADQARVLLNQLHENPGPNPPATPANRTRWFFAFFDGIDLWGGDILPRGAEAATPYDCVEICAAEPECRLFTYNSKANRCYPKREMGFAVRTPGAQSGVIFDDNLPPPELPAPPAIVAEFEELAARRFTGFWRTIYQPPEYSTQTLDACLRACRQDVDCTYVTFDRNHSRKCTIWRHRVSGTEYKRGAVSYRKTYENVAPTGQIVELGAEIQNP